MKIYWHIPSFCDFLCLMLLIIFLQCLGALFTQKI